MHKKPPFLLIGLFFLTLIVMLWWGFAFLTLPNSAPEWVNRARIVCFSLSDNGLPQAYGWMLLIGAPLMMISALLIAWGEEWGESKKYVRENRSFIAIILLLLLALMSESYFIGKKITIALRSNSSAINQDIKEDLSNYPRLRQTPPEFNLIDETGKSATIARARGQVLYITFAFAHCKAICPLLAEHLKKVHEAIGSEKSTVYIISLDPWRDTVGALAEMHKSWNLPPSMHVLSGTPEEVNKVLDSFKVPRARDEKTGDVAHPALVNIVSPEGELSYVFNGASPSLLIRAGKSLLTKSK